MKSIAFGVLAGLLMPIQAKAQDTDAQQMMADNAALPQDPASVRKVHAFGLCAARDVSSQSKLVLRGYPGSAASDKALFWIISQSNSCGKAEAASNFSPRALRGPIAEYFLKQDFEMESWMPTGRLLKLYDSPANEELAGLPADVRSNIVLVDIGNCVAQRNPTGVAALFGTPVASGQESQAFAALTSALAACLPPSVELKMSKFQLRGYLAEGAYRAAAAAAKARQ